MVRNSSVTDVPRPVAPRHPSHRQRCAAATRGACSLRSRFAMRSTRSSASPSAIRPPNPCGPRPSAYGWAGPRIWIGPCGIPEIDIPWVVARAADAPPAADDLLRGRPRRVDRLLDDPVRLPAQREQAALAAAPVSRHGGRGGICGIFSAGDLIGSEHHVSPRPVRLSLSAHAAVRRPPSRPWGWSTSPPRCAPMPSGSN